MASFVHLHLHSQFSILDALCSVDRIAQKSVECGMPAVALTDHGNMYGAVEFYKACRKEGVKPIIGCEVYLAPDGRFERSRNQYGKTAYHLTLLAKNQTGYHNLCKLTSAGFLEGFYYNPRIDHELLKKHSEGLICLSGCMTSEISQTILHEKKEVVRDKILMYQDLFKEDFFLEIQRHEMSQDAIALDGMDKEGWLLNQHRDFIEKQKKIEETLVHFSKELSIPLVATNDVHYIDREDWRSHEILINVQSGDTTEIWEYDSLGNPKERKPNPKRRTYAGNEVYFKTPEQMRELFQDLPEACDTTLEIAERCNVELDFETKHYPTYTPPDIEGKEVSKQERKTSVEKFLRKLCEEGIPRRYTPERLAKVQEIYPDRDPMELIHERLETELSVIVPKEMADYLLIVWDFIDWAKKQDIPVGPGRGSGAGSIVLYLIGITDIEPLRFHLFFERFINPERLSYPDIDVDICMSRRQEVINYTLEKYGKENVAQIITFGTMKAKMTIKDVGRVLNISLAKVNKLAKLVPEELDITLESALAKDAELRAFVESDEEAGRIIELGKKLEGCIRNTGIHAAGIVVSSEPLVEHIPICNSKDSDLPATQFSMKPVEQVGMLKIDFLGLKTLTSIELAFKDVCEGHGVSLDWRDLPLTDQKTFDLLNQGKTMGVFQLESGGMQDLARSLHLDRFEEIIAVGALYRPGPMDMIPSFIARKHGREAIENDHPWMKEILEETYGIMVYQEQVMQIAVRLAKYSLGEGDVLRRAMGKKDHKQMEREREKFISGCLENGIDNSLARQIFDKMEKFASYGFNKSHAAAYGYLSYVTAYLKANYPKEWLAALMTCDQFDISKVSKFIRECKASGIEVLSPDVNESKGSFTATDEGIRFSLSAIRGVGEGVVEEIVKCREKEGKYKSLYHFVKCIDTKKVGKKIIEALVDAGAFDFTKWTRDQLKTAIEPIYDTVSKKQKDENLGYMSLFDQMGDENEKRFEAPPQVLEPRSKKDLLLKEKELLGFFLTGHPMDGYKELLNRLSCVALRKVEEMDHQSVFRSALLIETVVTRIAQKSQRKFAILTVSDGIVSYELPVWPDLYEQKGYLLNENQLLYAVLIVEKDTGDVKLSCRWFDDLTAASEEMIAECDEVFDKSKSYIARQNMIKEKGKGKKMETKKEEKKVELVLQVDLGKIQMTDVMKLKKQFRKNGGSSPVKIEFQSQGKVYSNLSIPERWGVELTDSFLKELKKEPALISAEERAF